jgi:hypothetical protein
MAMNTFNNVIKSGFSAYVVTKGTRECGQLKASHLSTLAAHGGDGPDGLRLVFHCDSGNHLW